MSFRTIKSAEPHKSGMSNQQVSTVPLLDSLLDCDNSKDGMSAFFSKVRAAGMHAPHLFAHAAHGAVAMHAPHMDCRRIPVRHLQTSLTPPSLRPFRRSIGHCSPVVI